MRSSSPFGDVADLRFPLFPLHSIRQGATALVGVGRGRARASRRGANDKQPLRPHEQVGKE
jgi:hypothetical protein